MKTIPVKVRVRKGLFPILFDENLGGATRYFHTDTFETRFLQRKQFVILN